jgi:hypothetical protein
MLLNSTLLRVSDPPPAPPGPDISVRCAVASPTAVELATMQAMSLDATLVMYLPMGSVSAAGGAPSVGQHVTACVDGCPSSTHQVLRVADRVGLGGTLDHLQLFLGPVP